MEACPQGSRQPPLGSSCLSLQASLHSTHKGKSSSLSRCPDIPQTGISRHKNADSHTGGRKSPSIKNPTLTAGPPAPASGLPPRGAQSPQCGAQYPHTAWSSVPPQSVDLSTHSVELSTPQSVELSTPTQRGTQYPHNIEVSIHTLWSSVPRHSAALITPAQCSNRDSLDI